MKLRPEGIHFWNHRLGFVVRKMFYLNFPYSMSSWLHFGGVSRLTSLVKPHLSYTSSPSPTPKTKTHHTFLLLSFRSYWFMFQVEVVAAYGKTELWEAARAVDVEDFDFNQMAPSEAFWPRKAREGWVVITQDARILLVTTRMLATLPETNRERSWKIGQMQTRKSSNHRFSGAKLLLVSG